MHSGDEIVPAATEAPIVPKEPKRMSVRFRRIGDRAELVNTKRQWGSAAFLLLWLTGWTAGCVMLLGVVIFQFNFVMLLFALPFWAAWFFVASMVANMIASREELLLDEQGASYLRTVFGITVARRTVPLGDITSFGPPAAQKAMRDVQFAKYFHREALEMRTITAPLQLTAQLPPEEADWIAYTLNDCLTSLRRLSGPIDRSREGIGAISLDAEQLPDVLKLRPPSDAVVPRPSETALTLTQDLDVITFTERGTFSPAAVAGTLFICVFWNGIVGVFVAALLGFTPDGNNAAPHGKEWWFLFLFLIPFEIIGLVIFVALLFALLEPVRRSRWIFHRNAIYRRTTWLGIGRSTRYDVKELDRLELRKCDPLGDLQDLEDPTEIVQARFEAAKQAKQGVSQPTGVTFNLALVDPADEDVCEIEGLSLAEACWIADVILRERRGWFATPR
jgi:hypothetical protein